MNNKSLLTPKVEALFQAVDVLLMEGADIHSITVAQIAGRAGIGKGTTYEYFANKEELIAGALLYKISNISQEVLRELETQRSVREKIVRLLAAIDTKQYEKAFLLKVVNIVTDNSPVSQQIDVMVGKYAGEMYMPECILDYLLECAAEEGGLPAHVPVAYTKLNVASKLLTYTMYSLAPSTQWDCEPELMHKLVCDSICEELGIV